MTRLFVIVNFFFQSVANHNHLFFFFFFFFFFCGRWTFKFINRAFFFAFFHFDMYVLVDLQSFFLTITWSEGHVPIFIKKRKRDSFSPSTVRSVITVVLPAGVTPVQTSVPLSTLSTADISSVVCTQGSPFTVVPFSSSMVYLSGGLTVALIMNSEFDQVAVGKGLPVKLHENTARFGNSIRWAAVRVCSLGRTVQNQRRFKSLSNFTLLTRWVPSKVFSFGTPVANVWKWFIFLDLG